MYYTVILELLSANAYRSSICYNHITIVRDMLPSIVSLSCLYVCIFFYRRARNNTFITIIVYIKAFRPILTEHIHALKSRHCKLYTGWAKKKWHPFQLRQYNSTYKLPNSSCLCNLKKNQHLLLIIHILNVFNSFI